MRFFIALQLVPLLACLFARLAEAKPLKKCRPHKHHRAACRNQPAKNPTPGPATKAAVLPKKEAASGEVEVTFQSYYNRISGTTVANANGAAFGLQRFVPDRGLLSLHLEPVADRNTFAVGENYLQWKGLPWNGHHWDFALGDFRVGTALLPMPFSNLVEPDFSLRGASITARTANWRYAIYGGLETLADGPRVQFRSVVPQRAIGSEAAGNPWSRLKIGFRYLHLSASEKDLGSFNTYFPFTRQFTRSDSFIAQTSAKLTHGLEWYTEAGWSSAGSPDDSESRNTPYSFVTGPSWNSPRFVAHASYVREGAAYLPLLGYFLGDRSGVNTDGVLQLGRFGFSGSIGQVHNNVEQNQAVPYFSSRNANAGVQIRLPLAFSLNVSASKIRLETRSTDNGVEPGDDSQLNLSLSRSIFHHNLRASFQQLDVRTDTLSQRLRFFELGDNFRIKRLTLGGGMRIQTTDGTERKNSLFFRGNAQLQIRQLNLYAYIEQGKDLANSTLFATSISSNSVAGLSWSRPHSVEIQFEAMRNNLNSQLTPERIFILASQGVPIDTTLNRFDNWSVYFRASRRFDWGEQLSVNAKGEIQREAALMGTVKGYVKLKTTDSPGAEGVYVLLDSDREVLTSEGGYFEIPKVSEGRHTVAIDVDRLAAGFDPSGQTLFTVSLVPEKTTRVEFQVVPLLTLSGRVEDADQQPAPAGVVLHLSPGSQYTTTDESGRFSFFNLPEGNYAVELEEKSLPQPAELNSPTTISVNARYGVPTSEIDFIYQEVVLPAKLLQKVVLPAH